MRLKALLVVFLFAAACTPEQAAAPPPSARTSQQMAMLSDGVVPADRWRVVLIAGDNNSPAFDNGVEAMRAKLVARGVRDIRDLAEMQFPVWSKAIHAQGTVKATVGAVNVPIVCAGQSVTPGNVVVADDDGIVIVERAAVAAVLAAGRKRIENEASKRERLAKGELGLDLYNMRPRLKEAGLVYLDSLDNYHAGDK